MSFADYLENELLDHVFGAAAYTAPATLYVALSTTTPVDAGTNFTEPVGGSYARVAITNNATNWPAASGGAKANGALITFPAPTGDWGTITYFGIYDASSVGNLLGYAALSTPRVVNSGDGAPEFAIGDLDITLA